MNNRCIKTVFTRTILCAGTMQDYIKIVRREYSGSDVNETVTQETFTTVDEFMGYLEVRNPTQRFDGVNIASNITHIVYIPFDQTVYELDRNTLFVELEKIRNRYLKLVAVEDFHEQEDYLALYCTESGFTDLEGAQ